MSSLVIPVTADVRINFSAFISAIITFLIIAFVVFCLVKSLNSLQNAGKKALGKSKEEEASIRMPSFPRSCAQTLRSSIFSVHAGMPGVMRFCRKRTLHLCLLLCVRQNRIA